MNTAADASKNLLHLWLGGVLRPTAMLFHVNDHGHAMLPRLMKQTDS